MRAHEPGQPKTATRGQHRGPARQSASDGQRAVAFRQVLANRLRPRHGRFQESDWSSRMTELGARQTFQSLCMCAGPFRLASMP